MTERPSHCLNCGHQTDPDLEYCASCGQKNDAHILSVSEFVSTWWNSLFNMDSTVFRTLKYIFTPWKLTSFYLDGKRKSFLHPLRVFLILLLFYFGYQVSKVGIDNNKTRSNAEYAELEKSRLYEEFLHIRNQTNPGPEASTLADTIEARLFKGTMVPDKDTFLHSAFIDLGKFNYPITRKDAIELSKDSLYRKYNVTGFWDKLIVGQTIRMNLDRAGTINYALGNAAWGVLAGILVLAGFFKLLYFRKKMHYIAHLVLLLNYHSTLFFIGLLFALLSTLNDGWSAPLTTILLFVIAPILFFLTLYLFYRQGFLKTLAKFTIASGFYFIFGFTIILGIGVGSLAFF